MANIRLIKNRIKSAKNISQITRAMELVAASKMRKAQSAALSGKLYAQKIHDMVFSLASRTDITNHPLLATHSLQTGKRLVIIVSTNKGLCGGLNSTLFRAILKEYANTSAFEFVTLGKKSADFIAQLKGSLKADFSDKVPFVDNVPAITQLLTDMYLTGAVDGVDIVYNEFVSVLTQAPRIKTILPLTLDVAQGREATGEFLIEPGVREVFDALLPHYLENQVRDAVLQGEASEQSARMIAMRNATDNALSFMDELTLVYNKARQEKITYEISDMVTARLATE
ncbi:ATP synthase F1 subunit gamma [Candidatus Gottesmanbacteria bacterium RIFOXYB1_FULL_47_11]|uniref:ATP synthase gamma chain n=1 Tax=Candidatus Gottesmanbacteria bacterium RIFOXYB1_FULL_47_11 TaxID=1798401 RepID=A0A1F6BF82_9BACT|nr:MAG: ATP synthase F1 subunit gamma [Candidatus Gottesmanbacteria bacterium RIFOXYB1_FULL_47_11]